MLNILNVSCMNLCDPLFDVIDLKLVLSLNWVELLFKHADLTLEVSPFLSSFLGFVSNPSEELWNFVVFDANHLPEAVQLDVEQLVLILHTSLQVFELKVEDFFELITKFIKLLTLFFVGFLIGCSLLFNELLKSPDFIVLLQSHLLDSIANHSLDILFLCEGLLELPDLEQVSLFFLSKLLFDALELAFLVEVRLFSIFKHESYSFFLCFFSFYLPFFDLPLKLQLLFGPGIVFRRFTVNFQFDVFEFCFGLTELFFFFFELIGESGVLLEDEFVFEFEVLCSAQPHPRFVKIFLYGVAVIF